jgi:hypothetical protein
VKSKLLLYPFFERTALLEGKGVGFGNDGHNIDDVGKLLEYDNIDGLESVAGRLDEEEAAVDASVLDVSLSLGGEFFAEVGRVLVLDVLDNRVPATQC